MKTVIALLSFVLFSIRSGGTIYLSNIPPLKQSVSFHALTDRYEELHNLMIFFSIASKHRIHNRN